MDESVFSYKTRGNSRPDNKPKVYFTCHPEDFDSYFDGVCKDIHEANDCVIFYTEDMNSSFTDENTLVDLERMSLFVIPVTFKLLTTPNRAMDFDYKFAQEKNIPVLPLMMESNIYEFYKKPERFGELQYLKPNSTELTAIDYKDKLEKYLESVLISNELAQRIRKAFTAYIFLSYRKKDRKYANELMKLIHKITYCEDIAIWFDEFITPGENFRENIERILSDSVLFALLVTPRLLERQPDGSLNFIMREEYPKAKELNKPILPAEMENTDKEALGRDFKDLPECTDAKDEESFLKRLSDCLTGISISEINDDPEHNYLIGLAYLKGIDVEVDIERGLRLITQAAEADLPEAILKLYQMYKDGDTVNLDNEKALKWAKRLYEIIVPQFGEEHPYTLIALNNLAVAYNSCGDSRKAVELNEKCYEFRCRVSGEDHPDTITTLNNLATACDSLGDSRKAVELNEKCYEFRCRVSGEDHPDTITTLNNLAVAYNSLGDSGKAVELHEKCYETSCRVLGEEHPDTLVSLNNLASAYESLGDSRKAIELHEKCYGIRCRVLGDEHPSTLNSLCDMADAHESLGDYSKVIELQEKCYEVRRRVLGEGHPDTIYSLNVMANAYESLGDCRKAIELYKEVYEIRCRVLGEEHPDTIISLNDLAEAYYSLGDYGKAIELQEKCYEINCRVWGEEHPETLITLNNLATVYYSLGDYSKAIELQEKCYKIRCRVLGKGHADTLYSQFCLALSYRASGDSIRAINLAKDCYMSCIKELGDDHETTSLAHELLDKLTE